MLTSPVGSFLSFLHNHFETNGDIRSTIATDPHCYVKLLGSVPTFCELLAEAKSEQEFRQMLDDYRLGQSLLGLYDVAASPYISLAEKAGIPRGEVAVAINDIRAPLIQFIKFPLRIVSWHAPEQRAYILERLDTTWLEPHEEIVRCRLIDSKLTTESVPDSKSSTGAIEHVFPISSPKIIWKKETRSGQVLSLEEEGPKLAREYNSPILEEAWEVSRATAVKLEEIAHRIQLTIPIKPCWLEVTQALPDVPPEPPTEAAPVTEVQPPAPLQPPGQQGSEPPGPEDEKPKDGPSADRFIWWKGVRNTLPIGVQFKLARFMWNRQTATFGQLAEKDGKLPAVLDGQVEDSTIRGYVSELNQKLGEIGVDWHLTVNGSEQLVVKIAGVFQKRASSSPNSNKSKKHQKNKQSSKSSRKAS